MVDMRIVFTERVRMGEGHVTEEQAVSEEVREEQIETDGTDRRR